MIINESHEMSNEERTTTITLDLNVETEKRREKTNREQQNQTKNKLYYFVCDIAHGVALTKQRLKNALSAL